MFIKDHENLQKLSSEIQDLKYEINNKNIDHILVDEMLKNLISKLISLVNQK